MSTLKDLFDCDEFERMLGSEVVEAREGYGRAVSYTHLTLPTSQQV